MDVGVIFGMVIAIMVITLVFVFGYQQLTSLQDIQSSAELIKASQKLGVVVGRVYDGGGESSESLRLTFPSTVRSVCFIPLFNYDDEPRTPYTAEDLKFQLDAQGLAQGSNAEVIAQRRETAKHVPVDPVDYNVLVFFVATNDPKWYAVERLEPSIKEGDWDEYLFCAEPKETIWLQRKFDSDGAWVDAEEA
jgi:hypothetical protein